MTYKALELEQSFKKVARIRHGKEYKNDAGYWTGGRCEWGGSHSLMEDCQTFANAFNKIESLRDIKEELKKCTSKSEYDAKKNNYIRKCDEGLNGLQEKTASSFIFGVCCIWSDKATNKTVESKIKVVREDLQKIKDALNREDYKWVQELKDLELEINQINQRMEENKKKAMKETDPVKKAALIAQIEEDGSLLQQKYKKKQELANKFNFDPKKKVDNLIEAMKKAIEKARKKKPDGSGGGGNHKNSDTSDADNSDSDDESSDNDDNGSRKKRKKDPNSDWLQENKQLLIMAGIGLLAFFFLMNKNHQEEEF